MPVGLEPRPTGTLLHRALEFLDAGPADSTTLTHDVLGVRAAPPLVADRLAAALLGADPRVRRRGDAQWELVPVRATVSPRIEDCAFAVVDVETTGSRAGRVDRVIEIGIAVVSGGTVEMVVDTLVNPERPIPRVVSRLTNISPGTVAASPVFADVADEVVSCLAGRVFVAHNVRFDWAFVAAEVRRARDMVLEGPKLCTVRLAKRLIPGLKSRSLDSVSRYFGIDIARRHRAGDDAYATAEALLRLLDLAGDRGLTTLRDLEQLTRPRPRRKKKRSAMPLPMEEEP